LFLRQNRASLDGCRETAARCLFPAGLFDLLNLPFSTWKRNRLIFPGNFTASEIFLALGAILF